MKLPDGTSVDVVDLSNVNDSITATLAVTWPDGAAGTFFVQLTRDVKIVSGQLGATGVSKTPGPI